MKKAIMLKTKHYKFGISLFKGQEVFIKETDNHFSALKNEHDAVQMGVNLKDFKFI